MQVLDKQSKNDHHQTESNEIMTKIKKTQDLLLIYLQMIN